MTDHPTLNIENGCYVDGHHGIYAEREAYHVMVNWLSRIDHKHELPKWKGDDYEFAHEIIDELEEVVNFYLPVGQIAHWHDGEFFVSPYCDEDPDCDDETCACNDW